jgi:hypothetical protein
MIWLSSSIWKEYRPLSISFFVCKLYQARNYVLAIHMTTLHIPRRHLQRRKSWTVIGLFLCSCSCPFSFGHCIVSPSSISAFNDLFYHCYLWNTVGLILFICLLDFNVEIVVLRVEKSNHEIYFQIINIYSISGKYRASE